MGRRLTRQPAGPLVGTSTITTVKSTNRVDSGSFGSRCCTFRRTHTSADPIRLLFIRLPLLLTLSLPLQFAPSARVVAYVSTRALWLVEDFWYDCMFWDEMGGELSRQPVSLSGDTATITTVVTSKDRVDSGRFGSRCCAFRRTRKSADPIRLLCIRLALTLTLYLLSRFAPSARVGAFVSPRALWLAGDSSCDCII